MQINQPLAGHRQMRGAHPSRGVTRAIVSAFQARGQDCPRYFARHPVLDSPLYNFHIQPTREWHQSRPGFQLRAAERSGVAGCVSGPHASVPEPVFLREVETQSSIRYDTAYLTGDIDGNRLVQSPTPPVPLIRHTSGEQFSRREQRGQKRESGRNSHWKVI